MLKIFKHTIALFFALFILINNTVYSDWLRVDEVIGSSCIVTFGDVVVAGSNNGIYRSLDNGSSWSHFVVDNNYPAITDLSNNDKYIYAGTFNGVYSSADTGKTWSSIGPSFSILSVFAKDSILFACIHGGGLFRSENNGQSWIAIDGDHFYSYLLHDNKIIAGTFSGIYESIDNGLTWNFMALPNKITTSLAKNDKYFFATNYTYGIYRSDDYGLSWSESNQGLDLDQFHPNEVFAKDSLIFAGFSSNKIYLSTDNGLIWRDFSSGINISEETNRVRFVLSGNKIFASFLYNSLWYYDLSLITNVSELNQLILDKFMLQQNYPNPFNQSTKIEYSVPKSDHIILTIYDILGNEIKTLINEIQAPDIYSINFNANNLASGIYFYRFQIGKDFLQTRKMLLIR